MQDDDTLREVDDKGEIDIGLSLVLSLDNGLGLVFVLSLGFGYIIGLSFCPDLDFGVPQS